MSKSAKEDFKDSKRSWILPSIVGVVLLAALAISVVSLFSSLVVPTKFAILWAVVAGIFTVATILMLALKRDKRAWKIVLGVVSLLLVVANVAVVVLNRTSSDIVNVMDDNYAPVESAKPVENLTIDPFVLYISGKDASQRLSDVNLLAVVNPAKHKILLINTPRDTYVQVHGQTGLKDKLTHAGNYGTEISVMTMEDFYDIDINYYLQVNFDSLVSLVDAIGGIDVDSEYDFGKYHVGMNHLDGKAALDFSRQRKVFAEGDRIRGENQQRVLTAIVNKISSTSSLLNPDLTSGLKGSFATNISSEEMSKLVKFQLDGLSGWNIERYSINGAGASEYTHSYPNRKLYVMKADQSTVETARQKIAEALL